MLIKIECTQIFMNVFLILSELLVASYKTHNEILLKSQEIPVIILVYSSDSIESREYLPIWNCLLPLEVKNPKLLISQLDCVYSKEICKEYYSTSKYPALFKIIKKQIYQIETPATKEQMMIMAETVQKESQQFFCFPFPPNHQQFPLISISKSFLPIKELCNITANFSSEFSDIPNQFYSENRGTSLQLNIYRTINDYISFNISTPNKRVHDILIDFLTPDYDANFSRLLSPNNIRSAIIIISNDKSIKKTFHSVLWRSYIYDTATYSQFEACQPKIRKKFSSKPSLVIYSADKSRWAYLPNSSYSYELQQIINDTYVNSNDPILFPYTTDLSKIFQVNGELYLYRQMQIYSSYFVIITFVFLFISIINTINRDGYLSSFSNC